MTTYVCPLLVGRDAERAQLEAAIGARRVVVVSGPAGVGKSALVRGAAEGRPVVTGRATPSSSLRPYRPIVDAVLRARRLPGREHLPAALAQLTEPTAATTEVDPLLVADALVGWLADEVVVLEDLHWADAQSLEVVEQLADTGGLALVATAREELPPVRGAEVVALRPLGDLEIHEMAARCLGGALTARLAGAVECAADGLPLVVEELLAAFATDDRLEQTPDGWNLVGTDPSIPRSVADTVAPRLARLDDADRRILAAAAVVGRRFDWAVVAAATDTEPPAVLAALRRAADLQLLDPDPDRPGSLRFRHALTRDAVDALTFPPERAQLASRAFDALRDREQLVGDDLLTAAALARAAGRGDDAAPLLVDAAREAFDRNAFDAAEQLLEDACAVSDPRGPVHLRALQERLRVLAATGRVRDVAELGQHLLRVIPPDDGTGLLEVHLRMARSASEAREPQRAVQHVTAARRLLGPEHVGHCHPPRVDFEHALALLAAGDRAGAVEAAQRSVAGTFPDDPTREDNDFADVEAFALIAWAQAVRRDDPDQARALLDRADQVLAPVPQQLMSARIAVERTALDLDAGLADTPHLDRAERSARLAGGRGVVARIAILRGVAAMLRLDDAGVAEAAEAAESLADRYGLPARDDAALLRQCAAALRGQPSDHPVVAALAELAAGRDAVVPPIPHHDVLGPFAALSGERPSYAPWVRHQRARLVSQDQHELAEAAAWFAEVGLDAAAEATRDRLRALGIPFPRRRSALADVPADLQARGVTGRELEVLRLVATGLSNREVAERLFLSVRTVDKHVEHLLAKTGCANRTALASLATT